MSEADEAHDHWLVAAATRRDPTAWADLYQRFSGQLFGFFYHEVRNKESAEDLTAGVFMEALSAAARFSGDLAALRSWLFQIARNNLIDHFRRARRARLETLEESDPAEVARAGPSEDPEESALSNVERSRLLQAIDRLSPDQKEVILMRLNGGLTSAEIATITGRTQGAVKALQHRALNALAKALENERAH